MKRLILLLAVGLAGIRCAPDSEDIYYSSRWSVKNSTGQTLTISPAPYGETDPYILASGKEMNVYSRREYAYSPYFHMFMVCWRGVPEEDIHFDVSDAGGTLLTRWQLDYHSSSAKNFFNEDSWTYSYNHDKRKKKTDHWSFEILPEDIQ